MTPNQLLVGVDGLPFNDSLEKAFHLLFVAVCVGLVFDLSVSYSP
jgi:hypothetical protein